MQMGMEDLNLKSKAMTKYVINLILLLTFYNNVMGQNLIYTKSKNGPGDNQIYKSIIDAQNNVYVIGNFSGTIELDGNSYTSNGPEIDAYVAKFNQDGLLLWFKQISSTSYDYAVGLDLSKDGTSIYVVGYFYGNSCEFGGENINNYSSGSSDSFIANLKTSDGTIINLDRLVYGDNHQMLTDIKVDNFSNIVITGYVVGDGITSYFDNTNIICSGPRNYFLLQLNENLTVNWIKHYTANDPNNNLYSIDLDNTGYYIAGMNRGTLNLDLLTLNSVASSQDMFLFKTDFNGNGQWVRKITGSAKDVSQYATCDQQGHVYISGYYASTDLKVDSTATLQSTRTVPNKGSNDIFFAKYTTDGTLQWFDVAGSTGDDRLTRLSTDGENIVIAGQFGGPMTFNNETLTPEGGTDALGIVHDKNDNLLYAIKAGGSGNDVAQSCVIDSEGNYIFTGNFYSPTLKFDSNPANDLTNATPSTRDVFIAKYKSRSISFVIDTVDCYGSATGSIVANPKGAWAGDLTYAWTKTGDPAFTASTRVISNLTAGVYNCTISSGLYSETASVTLVEPAVLAASENMASHGNASCFGSTDGALALTVTGGTGTRKYVWTGNGTGIIAANAAQNALSAGTYTATVTDDNNCTATVSNMVITQPSKVIFKNTVVTKINGSQGAVDLNVQGGTPAFTYSWTGPSGYTATTGDISGLTVAGNYQVTLTDQNSCHADTTVLIVDSHALYAYISQKTDVGCFGGETGSLTVTAETSDSNPSYTYAWSGPDGFSAGTATISNLKAGSYSVTVTDVTPDPDKTYTITGIIITEPASALTTGVTKSNATCFGLSNGFVDANASGGTIPYSYQWKKDGNSMTDITEVITGLGQGTYEVTVTDARSCTASISADIAVPTAITVTDAIITPVTCNGTKNDGTIALNVSGGTGTYAFRWSNGLTTQNIGLLSAGTYNCAITDVNNCTVTTQQTVGQPAAITASFTTTHVSCFGGSNGAIDLTPAGGNSGAYTFSWSNSQTTEDISSLAQGTYTVKITDSKNCEKSFNTTLTQPQDLNISLASLQHANCNGVANGSISVSTSGGTTPYLYTWSNSQNGATISNLAAGDYTVTLTDGKNCTKNASYTINEPTPLVVTETLTSHVNVTCNGNATGALEVSASGSSGSYEYSLNGTTWQTSGLFSLISAGNYDVMVRDQSVTGCTRTLTPGIVISQPQALAFSSAVSANISCAGLTNGSVQSPATGGTGTLLYKLLLNGVETSNTSGASNGEFTGLAAATTYSVEVTDAGNCKLSSNNYAISEPQAIAISNVSATQITCSGLTNGIITAQAAGGTGALTYKLMLSDTESGNTTGATSGSFTGLAAATTYKVEVTDANNCGPVSSQVQTITSPAPIAVSSVTPANITCSGLTNGTINVQATGGNGNYSYKLMLNSTLHSNVTGASTGIFTGLAAATGYTVEVTDANNCSPALSAAVNIQEPAAITIATQHATRTTGAGANDGSINIIAAGGSGSLNYSLGTLIQSNGIFSGLPIGTYQVTITDNNNCGPVSSNLLVVDGPTEVGNLTGATVRLYPNPAAERVFVEVKNQEYKLLKVELKSISGQAFLTQKYENAGDGFVADIDLSVSLR